MFAYLHEKFLYNNKSTLYSWCMYMKYSTELLKDVSYAFQKLKEYTPEVGEKFQEFLAATLKEGRLTLREKELVLVGIAVALRCEHCIAVHIKKALEAGAKPEEIAEAIALAVLMGGGPVATTSSKAFKILDELIEKKS